MTKNPFNFTRPVSSQKLVGRWEQIQEVANDLMNPGGNSHAVIGGRRFGKTSFLLALQDILIKQLSQKPEEDLTDWYVFPVYIELKNLGKRSPEGVFGLMLYTLYEYLYSSRRKRELGITLAIGVEQTLLYTFAQNFEQNAEEECTFTKFSKIVEELLDSIETDGSQYCLTFLIDEVEVILEEDWTERIFSQLRYLIYASPLSRYVRCVLAGSAEIIAAREQGSPLLNVLRITYLEALDNKDIGEIIDRADNITQDIIDAVLEQCGGHPFLAQYIIHFVWESQHSQTAIAVPAIVGRFYRDRRGDLEQWQADLGEVGLIVYHILAHADTWLTEPQVKRQVNDVHIIPKVGAALVNLCYHGLVRHNGTWSKYRVAGLLFKNWFVENILPTLDAQPPPNDPSITATDRGTPPTVDVHFMNNYIFPTAYCEAISKESFPFVTCTIDNTGQGCINTLVVIEVTIRDIGQPYRDTLPIASGQREQVVFLPRLSRNAIMSLTEISRPTCRVRVERGTETLHDKDYDIELYAYDTALLAIWTPDGLLAEDLADYLAVFVTPHQPAVEQLVRLAVERHPRKAMPGYQGAEYIINGQRQVNLTEARNISQLQAKAFFETLKKEVRLRYTNALGNFGKQPHQTTQRVRLPMVSLANNSGLGQANCIDGAVLFASLLENLDMEPLIVIVPGHAFVGWRIWAGVNEYDFLETTMIATRSFQAALDKGNSLYQNAIQNGYSEHSLFHPEGFVRVVDIAACRQKKINPLM